MRLEENMAGCQSKICIQRNKGIPRYWSMSFCNESFSEEIMTYFSSMNTPFLKTVA